MSWDLFVSHASEDKSFVRPLVDALRERGLDVWYDEDALTLGDSLLSKIDERLAKCEFGVVILSDAFLAKDWTRWELEGLVSREVNGKKIILPVWHGVDRKDVASHSPILAGRVAVDSRQGVAKVAAEIERAMRAVTQTSAVMPSCRRPGRLRSSAVAFSVVVAVVVIIGLLWSPALRNAASRIDIRTTVDDAPVEGCVLFVDNVRIADRSPHTIIVEPGREYSLRALPAQAAPGQSSTLFTTGHVDVVAPEEGAELITLRIFNTHARPLSVTTLSHVRIPFVAIASGQFKTGAGGVTDPIRTVHVTYPFFIARYELTIGQYRSFARESRLHAGWEASVSAYDDSVAAHNVDWDNAAAFCRWLTEKSDRRLPGYVYRLPTEAEWEYCCRGNESEQAILEEMDSRAWFRQNAKHQEKARIRAPKVVGLLDPNGWGLYDMFGNVDEMTFDSSEQRNLGGRRVPWTEETLREGVLFDPWNKSGAGRVLRGGNHATERGRFHPSMRFSKRTTEGANDLVGFRVVLAPKLDESKRRMVWRE